MPAEIETRRVSISKWWNPWSWEKCTQEVIFKVSFDQAEWDKFISESVEEIVAASEVEPEFYYHLLQKE